MAKIIISYRRLDADVFAGRVRDRLAARFGDDSVFIDVDNIPFGKDFRVHIQETLETADAVLVVIGPKWLGVGKGGRSRIQDAADPVRIEVETALAKGILTIPILVGKTEMPKPEQLPETLGNFSFFNAAPVDTGRDFHRDLNRVIATIDSIMKVPTSAKVQDDVGGRKGSYLPLAGAIIAGVIVICVAWWQFGRIAEPPKSTEVATSVGTHEQGRTSVPPSVVVPGPFQQPGPNQASASVQSSTAPPAAAVDSSDSRTVDPGADVVRAFYTALGRGDGAAAAALVVPERQKGGLSAQSMTDFFSGNFVPLRLISVTPYGQNTYQATYTFQKGQKSVVCANSVIVAVTQRNGSYLVQSIDARGGC